MQFGASGSWGQNKDYDYIELALVKHWEEMEEKLGHRYMADRPKHILILFSIYGEAYTLFYKSATIFSQKGSVKLGPGEIWLHTS